MKKDVLIINHLRKNARETLTSISKKTRIPVSTIYEKLRSNEGKLILKHTSLIHFGKLGFNARANVMVKTSISKRDEMRRYLFHHQNVNSLFKINNGYDFMIECVFKDMKVLEEFIDHVDEKFGLERSEVFYVIEDLKRECFMADPNVMPVGA